MKKNTIICLLAAVASALLLPSCMVSGGGYGSKGGMAYGGASSPVQLGFAVQLNSQQGFAGGGGGYGGGCAPQRVCPPPGYGRPQGPPPGYRPQQRPCPPQGYGQQRQRPPQYYGGQERRRPCPPQYGGYDPRVRQPAPGRRPPPGYGGGRREPNSVSVYGHTYSDANPSGYRPLR